jgi:hypothetical protein
MADISDLEWFTGLSEEDKNKIIKVSRQTYTIGALISKKYIPVVTEIVNSISSLWETVKNSYFSPPDSAQH